MEGSSILIMISTLSTISRWQLIKYSNIVAIEILK